MTNAGDHEEAIIDPCSDWSKKRQYGSDEDARSKDPFAAILGGDNARWYLSDHVAVEEGPDDLGFDLATKQISLKFKDQIKIKASLYKV